MIIDTSVMVSAVERKDPAAIAALSALGGPSQWSFIVAGELAAGVEAARALKLPKADQRMRAATLTAYSQLSEQPVALTLDDLSAHFGSLTAICSARRIRLGQNDRWILASAAALSTQVLTADATMHHAGTEAGRAHGDKSLTILVRDDRLIN